MGTMPPALRRLLPSGVLALALAAVVPLSGVPSGPAGRAVWLPLDWKTIDRLVAEQKFEEAARATAARLAAARKGGDEAEWTRALIREAQLRTGLHGWETAVRFLKEEPWPKGVLSRVTLELYYARSLDLYAHAYSWEIRQRERVESAGAVDLKAWTAEQISDEETRAYLSAWKERETLGNEGVSALSEYLEVNDYPKGVRPTLRDTVSYLFASHLADSSGWSPEQSNEVFRLDLARLLSFGAGGAFPLDGPAHPLEKAVAVLADLEGWHAARGEREAALEARLERARRLHAAFTEESDRAAIESDLERRLTADRGVPWYAMGKAQLALFVEGQALSGDLVRARAIALEGSRTYPDSVGGRQCQAIAERIAAPEYRLEAMANDGPERRSIRVEHRNVHRLKFRAYAVDLAARVARLSGQRDLLPGAEEIKTMVGSSAAAAEWSVELPATPDFKRHATYIVPPLKEAGLYIVAASGAPTFGSSGAPLVAARLLVSDLVLILPGALERGGGGSGVLEVEALSGATGRPLSGTEVQVYRVDWSPERSVEIARGVTDTRGRVGLSLPSEAQFSNRFVFARRDADLALDQNLYFGLPAAPEGTRTASLVFTDRSIYRPQQTLFWKVLAWRGEAARGRLEVYPGAPVTVTLVDQNNQKVEEKVATTDAFGSAAGEFTIPSGRALGSWRVQSSLSGSASVRVEEYKRPTFEVSFKDPSEPLRLNRPARLRGEARYYFGLPVASGTARWSVTRTPQWFWWSPWWGITRPGGQTQTVAAGTSPLSADGAFDIAFTPAADERLGRDSKDLTYTYAVSADVADEGGETHSASRTFRVGFVSVEARISLATGFVRPSQPGHATFTRTSLDGVPRPGRGSWRLLRLVQPPVRMPAEEPVDPAPAAADFQTPGDAQRPRWDAAYAPERILRRWKDGEEIGRGDLAHDAKGEATIELPSLSPGAYRLRYRTEDEFGAGFEVPAEFLCAGRSAPAALPAILAVEKASVPVGGTARFLVASGLPEQTFFFDLYRAGRRVERRILESGRAPAVVEMPITEKDRGGFGVKLSLVHDHQYLTQVSSVFVPWDDRELKVSFESFRDRLSPGARETWKVRVEAPEGGAEHAAAEILAYMYDRSLDAFVPHSPPDPLALYPNKTAVDWCRASLGEISFDWIRESFRSLPSPSWPRADRLKFFDSYAMGGPGLRNRVMAVAGGQAMPAPAAVAEEAPLRAAFPTAKAASVDLLRENKALVPAAPPAAEATALRSQFAETAFWKPQLLIGPDGTASIEFTVPDSVTSWNVFVHAITKDWKAGFLRKEAKSVKELMVRPYVPRFLREGDEAVLKVVVNNASAKTLSGRVVLDVLDPETNASVLADFGLSAEEAGARFAAAPDGSSSVSFTLAVPRRVGLYAVKVTASAGGFSDGELRPVPLLPGRMHLMQSRFVALHDRDRREMTFADLAKNDDPTRINDQMVVTVDAQLFYAALEALPYLVRYPYECTEQTLNRFVSTGIVSSLFRDYPAVARMAEEMGKRDTRLETWDTADPNRRMALEETPWLEQARGDADTGLPLIRVLDPRVAKAERESSIAKLRKAQTASGGFPWWPGGPPSTYMTLYILHGFANALEFGVEVPKDMVQRAFGYAGSDIKRDLEVCMSQAGFCPFATFVNYVLSSYPDEGWYGAAFDAAYRKRLLDYSFARWKEHCPYLKGQLSLTLKRMGRPKDGKLVWDSVMDSAKTDRDVGTSFAPEDRSWLWYNDTIETQAYALRTLSELEPKSPQRAGLAQWLMLNKKLNHWKSTRATAEVIYSLAYYLRAEGALGVRESATVTVGGRKTTFAFEPDRYTGRANRVVVPGDKLGPADATVVVEKEGRGLAFASATWHFSTEKLPEEDRGDFFAVSRRYVRREATPQGFILKPLADGSPLSVGDEVEVQISLRAKHAAEYVHLRDPRAAGLEPGIAVSRWKWDLGLSYYEETRDSGSNFFFEWLPAGEYTFKYRLRANMAGTFKVAPATVQSMYAPEFAAYSAGAVLAVRPAP
jgi:hypothetical protein